MAEGGGGEFDPTTENENPTGASWKDDDNADENTSFMRKKPSEPGARPKNPYSYERINMSKFPSEKDGLPRTKRGPRTTETSFIEGLPSGRVLNPDSLKLELAHQRIEQNYPQYGKDGKRITLVIEDGKVLVVGPRGGRLPLFKSDGTINQRLSKLKVRKSLGQQGLNKSSKRMKRSKSLTKPYKMTS